VVSGQVRLSDGMQIEPTANSLEQASSSQAKAKL